MSSGQGWQWHDEDAGRRPPYGGEYDPYAQTHGAGYPQGPGYPAGPGYPPPQHETDGVYTHAIVALVIGCILALSCYVSPGGIAGAIMSGIALGKARTEPDRARKLLTWSWVSIGINIALLVIGLGIVIYLGVNGHLD